MTEHKEYYLAKTIGCKGEICEKCGNCKYCFKECAAAEQNLDQAEDDMDDNSDEEEREDINATE